MTPTQQLVAHAFSIKDANEVSNGHIERQVGVARKTLSDWRTFARSPGLDVFVRFLDAMGYRLQIVRKEP